MTLTTTDTLTVVEGVKSFDIVTSPDGLVYDPQTGEVTDNSVNVEVWMNDPDEGTRTKVNDLTNYGLQLTAAAGVSDIDTSPEEKTGTVTYEEEEPGETKTFAQLIEEFNAVLDTDIDSSMGVYDYLKECFEYADKQWKDTGSRLFSEDTYPEVFDYHGDNKTYYDKAYDAMQSWLMAMCLSEIVPTKGGQTNMQTQLFAKAYALGGGADIPLYGTFDEQTGNMTGGLHIHADPMIARYAAGAVYAIVRGRKEAYTIAGYRKELNGEMIPKTEIRHVERNEQQEIIVSKRKDWYDLLYNNESEDVEAGTDDKSVPMTYLGYLVNAGAFLPGAPGPWMGSYSSPQPNLSSLFYGSGNSQNWKDNNYKVDVRIDKEVTDNYVAYDADDKTFSIATNDKEKAQRLVECAVISRSSDFCYFGRKRVKYIGTLAPMLPLTGSNRATYYLHRFEETDEAASSNNKVFDVAGPFSEFQEIMFTGNGTAYSAGGYTTGEGVAVGQSVTLYTRTAHMDFFLGITDIADNSRFPLFTRYKRLRPLSGAPHNNNNVWTADANRAGQTDPLAGFECGSLSAIFSDYASEVEARTDPGQDDYPGDAKAASYPSGHSAMVWTEAMLLGQMKSYGNDEASILDFMKKAYRFSVNRSVSRNHWNSDLIYGRLFGTMILPIINAMTSIQTGYESARSAINGGSGGTAKVEYDAGGSSDTITIIVVNNTGSTISLCGRFGFFVTKGDGTTGETSMPSVPSLACDVAAGQSSQPMTYPLNAADLNLKGLRFSEDVYGLHNVIIYDANGSSSTIIANGISTSETFKPGATYTLNVGGNNPSTVAGGGGGGSTAKTISFSIKNNTGKTMTIQPYLTFVLKSNNNSVKTEKLVLQSGVDSIEIASGETKSFSGITVDSVSAKYIGCRFVGQSELGDLPGNAILYEPGEESDAYKMPLFSTSDRFEYGASYTIEYGGSQIAGNPVISVGVKITNKSGAPVTIEGRLKFVLGNPDHNGNYLGWDGSYNRTADIWFSDSNVAFAVGETKTFTGLSWRDNDTGCGLGEKSPANEDQLVAAGRRRNVLVYVNNNSETVLCKNMSSDIVFKDGGMYDIEIES